MKKEIWFGIGGMVVGVLVVSLFSSATPFRSMMWGGNYPNNQTSSRTAGMANSIDRHFIEQMIPHHDGAIAMAKLALAKATHPEIKTLSGAIIEAQEREIRDMQDWYRAWFGKDVPKGTVSMMNGGMMSQGGMHMGGQEDMQALENAADFDRAFIEQMIPHHQLAIMMAQMLESGSDRPEMLTLADNIIESQAKEIKDMQDWYQRWYK